MRKFLLTAIAAVGLLGVTSHVDTAEAHGWGYGRGYGYGHHYGYGRGYGYGRPYGYGGYRRFYHRPYGVPYRPYGYRRFYGGY